MRISAGRLIEYFCRTSNLLGDPVAANFLDVKCWWSSSCKEPIWPQSYQTYCETIWQALQMGLKFSVGQIGTVFVRGYISRRNSSTVARDLFGTHMPLSNSWGYRASGRRWQIYIERLR